MSWAAPKPVPGPITTFGACKAHSQQREWRNGQAPAGKAGQLILIHCTLHDLDRHAHAAATTRS
eukprot:scaffold122023_cov21-Tisochrysis_lutea.AAC.1